MSAPRQCPRCKITSSDFSPAGNVCRDCAYDATCRSRQRKNEGAAPVRRGRKPVNTTPLNELPPDPADFADFSKTVAQIVGSLDKNLTFAALTQKLTAKLIKSMALRLDENSMGAPAAKVHEPKQKSTQTDSAAEIPAPIAQIPPQVAEIPAPIAEKPAPIAQIPAPTVEIPAPIAQKPPQVVEIPTSIAQIPPQVAQIPAPIAQIPVPTAEIPPQPVTPRVLTNENLRFLDPGVTIVTCGENNYLIGFPEDVGDYPEADISGCVSMAGWIESTLKKCPQAKIRMVGDNILLGDMVFAIDDERKKFIRGQYYNFPYNPPRTLVYRIIKCANGSIASEESKLKQAGYRKVDLKTYFGLN